jgi:hypothetical protein
MKPYNSHPVRAAVALLACSLPALQTLAQDSPPDQRRAEQCIMDPHKHVAGSDERIERGGGIMDRAGIGVRLSVDTTVPVVGKVSRFT